jgi:two-component SAPR family response regulator
LLMTVGIGEDDLKYIREIFAGMKLEKEYRLTTYMDTLEAALAIGKEKPDLLLIKIMKTEGDGVEFARKIRSIHSDIKIIFMSDSLINRDEKGEVESLENVSITVGRKRLHREIVKTLGLHDRK